MADLGYDCQLFLLAFDHRASFVRQLLGIEGAPRPADAERVSDAKSVIFDGFMLALASTPGGLAGILVDEEYGADLARRAAAAGAIVALPVEASGRQEFDFEYGDAFGEHVERFDPTFAKVLVRYNPDEASANRSQIERLRRLSEWLHARDRKFLFELLVPATPQQLASVNGDADRFDREVRPTLVLRTLATLQAVGVEPDIWKIEGLDSPEDCHLIARQARRDGRDGVACIVLGRAASDGRVESWLQAAANVPGFRGFAIGRTIWWDALVDYRDGRIGRTEAGQRIAARYLRAIDVYTRATVAARHVGATEVS